MTGTKLPVIVAGTLKHADPNILARMSQYFQFVSITAPTRDDFIAQLKGGHYGEFYAMLFIDFEPVGRLNPSVLALFPRTVKIIAIGASGYDCVDVKEATRKGIWVTNAPGCATEAVADLGMFLLLAAWRIMRSSSYGQVTVEHSCAEL
ncbi:hypothetical protein HK104_005793 [Borealophlyctis nickersoniae]|nr:hypothetical protein HK104_005793 [Borealophlyctis nickersoniae]